VEKPWPICPCSLAKPKIENENIYSLEKKKKKIEIITR
jgi:hypothetical protein